jgi:hypothetical protein
MNNNDNKKHLYDFEGGSFWETQTCIVKFVNVDSCSVCFIEIAQERV